MTSDAPTLVLRLSVPAGDEFRAVAADMAVKIAEHFGGRATDAASTGETIQALAADVAPSGRADEDSDITFEFHRVHGELRIEAQCAGRSSNARHPLPT
jgi:hypothetical protein